MPKLWELLFQDQKPSEEQDQLKSVHNPLGLTIDARLNLDVLDYRGPTYRIAGVREHRIEIDGKNFQLVDYDLIRDRDEPIVRLRLIPEDRENSKFSYRPLLLKLDDEFGFNDEFDEIVRDKGGVFEINTDGEEAAQYFRPNLSKKPDQYEPLLETVTSDTKVLIDENRDGKVQSTEVSTATLEIWDFTRNAVIEGVETDEFVYVEMDKSNGYFQIWKGREVDPDAIDVI